MNSSINKNSTASFVKGLLLFGILLISMIEFSSCTKALPVKAEFAYRDIVIEYGTKVPDQVSDYLDLQGLSPQDQKYILKNTKIEYNGILEEDKDFEEAGSYTLELIYKGRPYRKYSITVKDTKPPEFVKVQDLYTFEGLELNQDDIDYMFVVKDNNGYVDFSINRPNISFNKAGTYEIIAKAKDRGGNTSTATAKINVQKPRPGAKGEYVFVSIKNQTCTYYKDGAPNFSCDVVTGDSSKRHDTPTGTYRVLHKGINMTLKGQEDNGDEYESFVQYWMAFLGGSYGLHSADWRWEFGGEIYKFNGSHGCVNMSVEDSRKLYDLVRVGTPVLVY